MDRHIKLQLRGEVEAWEREGSFCERVAREGEKTSRRKDLLQCGERVERREERRGGRCVRSR